MCTKRGDLFQVTPAITSTVQCSACSSYLCFFQQICEDWEPVWNQHLQLQSDDGQGQRGAFELPKLVAGHTVLHLPGPQHRLEARRRLLRPQSGGEQTGARCGVPGHACAEPDGRNEVRVAGDEQGMELGREESGEERDQNLVTMMMSLCHCPPILLPYGFIDHISAKYTKSPRPDAPTRISEQKLSLQSSVAFKAIGTRSSLSNTSAPLPGFDEDPAFPWGCIVMLSVSLSCVQCYSVFPLRTPPWGWGWHEEGRTRKQQRRQPVCLSAPR